MTSMADMRKNLEQLEKTVDELCKSGPFGDAVGDMLDGAATKTIENVKVKSPSGGTGDVPKASMKNDKGIVDGAEGNKIKPLEGRKGGSGAGVGSQFLGMNQTGTYMNDGAKDKEAMKKAAKPKQKAKGKK